MGRLILTTLGVCMGFILMAFMVVYLYASYVAFIVGGN